jgi:ABC-type spermidine/putrescine transport system permease subunit II
MTREERTRLYLIMAHLGGLATVSVFREYGFALPDFVQGVSIGVMVVPLAVMLVRRFRDEYIETLWQSGTSLAFAAVVVVFLILPFLEGVYGGFTANGSGRDIPSELAGFADIVAFYGGFHVLWLRGLR